jgi:hypothetical protein
VTTGAAGGLFSVTLDEALSSVEWNAKTGLIKCPGRNVFTAFPKLDLMTTAAKATGLLRLDFGLQDYNPCLLNPVFNINYSPLLVNLAALIYPGVKFSPLRSWILNRWSSGYRTKSARLIGSLNLFQEYFFFHLRPVSAF